MSLFRMFIPGLVAALMVAVSPTAASQPSAGGTFNTPGYAAPDNRTDEDRERRAEDGERETRGQRSGREAEPSERREEASPPAGMPRTLRGPSDSTDARRGEPRRVDPSMDRMRTSRSNPPPRPSEFQKFVEAATGRMLPMFGANFFADAAGGPASLDNVPVAADYVVGPGDELVIRAWGSIDVDYRTTVDRNGQVSLPQVGTFNVAGVKASGLEGHLRSQIGRLFTNFDLNVTMGQLRGVRVFVVGPAVRPGVYTLPSQSTLLSAAVAVGGPAPHGSMRKLLLRRNGNVISELDVYEFLVQGDKSKDVQLAPGDVVVFQPVGPRVAVNGAIDTPAIYELRGPQESLRDVLRYAGGAPVLASPHRAQLERIDPAQPKAARFVEEFQLDAPGLQKPLRDGDVLNLLPISPQFANAVTLKGHVAQPLRYAHTPGMRIRDLIPDKEALISPDFYRRKNLLVQVLDKDPAAERDAPRPPQKAPAALFDELNWDYAVVERLSDKDLSTQVIPFNLGAAILRGDPQSNIELLPGDVVTIYSQKDIRVPVARQTRLVALEGEVNAPGVYQLLPGETLKSLLARAGGFTPQAYLYGLQFSREETRVRQRENLDAALARLEAQAATQSARNAANSRGDDGGAANSLAVSNAATRAQLARLSRIEPNGRIALELDPAMNTLDSLPDVPLEGADRISVPSRPGFITVAGAVVNTNSFLWRPDRTAGDYVRVAGLDEGADASNMFILRADGTVSHAGDHRGLFGLGGLSSAPIHPGDAVIVPNQLDYETWGRALVRNLKDWSQIFSQFGLGAAAIQTLRRD